MIILLVITTSKTLIVAASGGTAPYTYFWSLASLDNIPITLGAVTTVQPIFSGGTSNQTLNIDSPLDDTELIDCVVKCRITDAAGRKVHAYFKVRFVGPVAP